LIRAPGFYADEERQDVQDDAPEPPPSCPVCGRRPLVVLLKRDPDFYQNRSILEARIDALMEGEAEDES
jgi:hypothetical protein